MFGQALRRQRIRLGLSQDDLAARAGVDVKTIGNLETGRTRPRRSTVRLLADALRLDGDARADFYAWAATETGVSDQKAETAIPAQLPAAVAAFTGRRIELARLDDILTSDGAPTNMDGGQDANCSPGSASRQRPAVIISAISGTAGVGKTTLAVYWAHSVADRFPDGQLYLNLRGFDPSGSAVAPTEAVRRLLDALGVAPARVPVDLDAQAALYRSQLSGRRMLILLDNARDSAQVRPLLPGAAGCMVLLTSRNQLRGLMAADDAHLIDLDVLSVTESRQLLTRRLGSQRVAAEPDAVADIITGCAQLPLALALVAAHATARPRLALRAVADELADARQRWQTLTGDDPHTDLRAVFSWSYQALTPAAARLFRLLGLHPSPDISAPAAASLTGLPIDAVLPLLAELTRVSLLTEPTASRYSCHDLLRDYARQLADTVDTDAQRHAATGRILDHYLHTADHADRLLRPATDPIPLAPAGAGVTPEQLADHDQALDWFTREHPVLLAAVAHAATLAFDTHTWQLALALVTFDYRRGHWHDQVIVGRAAVAAAQRLADPAIQLRTHRLLADAYARLGRFGDAYTQLRHTLDLAARTGDHTQQAHTHYSLSSLSARQGKLTQALQHADQALDLFRATGHQSGEARTLNAVGWCHAELGEYRQALSYCEQGLTLHQQLGDRDGQAATWDSLGYAHHHLGQHIQALTCYQHALALTRDLGDRRGQADTLTHLGDTHHATGDLQAARESWQQALTILDDLDHPDAEQIRSKLTRLDLPAHQARARHGQAGL